MAEHVTLREVGLRDGIQMAKRFLETDRKREWARRLIAAGVREIELTSFVPPKIVPQFADADVLATSLPDFSGAVCSALVPNLKGAERALAAGFRHINYVLSVSEAHSQANVRRSTEEAVVELDPSMRTCTCAVRPAWRSRVKPGGIWSAAAAFPCRILSDNSSMLDTSPA